MPDGKILLFVPMYNCARQIGRVVGQLTSEVAAVIEEVLLVDNRSTDGSVEAAIAALSAKPELSAKVMVNDQNYGLGGSHKVAFDYALLHAFDYVIVLHGDDQGSIGDLMPLLRSNAHLEVDCLLGARFLPGSRLKGYSVLRTIGNRVFNQLYSIVSGVDISDLGSGLNLYAVPPLRTRGWMRHPNDLTFNYHMILHSIAAGHRIRFFPIEWREDDQISNVKLVRQSLRVLGVILEYAVSRRRYLAKSFAGDDRNAYSSTLVSESPHARAT